MNYAISTLMFKIEDMEKWFDYTASSGTSLEIFPLWHDERFEEFLESNFEKIKNLTFSFHEPYFFTDHSFGIGTKEHEEALLLCEKTFQWAEKLGAKHMVFHHNNRKVSTAVKEDMIKAGNESLKALNEMASRYHIPVLVENCGVTARGNMLLNEEEFVALFQTIPNDCLFDIGHAHANGWNIPGVIKALKDKIVAYHINDNDGSDDQHRLMGSGNLDFQAYMKAVKEFTPTAAIIFEHSDDVAISVNDMKRQVENFKKLTGVIEEQFSA